MLVILNLSEPYVVNVEPDDEHGITLTDHIVPGT